MIIIKIHDIHVLGFSYFWNIIWHIFNVWNNASLIYISTVTWPPPIFSLLRKLKTIPIQISFINFSIFHEFVFLNRNFSAKCSVSPYIFHIKRMYSTHILRLPPFYYNYGKVWFFFQINILGIPWILHIQKLKKNHGADFSKRNQLGPP